MVDEPKVGYFSMEMALEAGMPTYSGGLGVLAGDMVRAAADLKVPVFSGHSPLSQGLFLPKDRFAWLAEPTAGGMRG